MATQRQGDSLYAARQLLMNQDAYRTGAAVLNQAVTHDRSLVERLLSRQDWFGLICPEIDCFDATPS